MPHFDQEVFVCLDCETTGLDAVQDRVIEVAVMRFTIHEVIDQFETLINPECSIPSESMAFHKISDEMVKSKPTIKTVLPQLLQFMGSNIIVGHGVGFDIQLLINAAERHHIDCSLSKNRFLDTLRMARLYGESPVNSLEQLRRHFNVEPEGAHRAMSDVIVNVEVFKRLAKDYKSVDDLFAALAKPILFKNMPLGKHKGRSMKDLPLQYLLWAARQEFDNDLLYSLRHEINRRKKGNLFSQASNPFASL